MGVRYNSLAGRDILLPPPLLIALSDDSVRSFMQSSASPELTSASVSTAAPAGVWRGSGDFTGQPDHSIAADTIDIVSDSALDTSAGTGAQTVDVVGLDGSWVEATETVTLNGTTPVTTVADFRRVFRVDVATFGAGASTGNAGTITAHATGDAAVKFAHMAPRSNRAAAAAFTMPLDHCGVLQVASIDLLRIGGLAGTAEVWVDKRVEGGPFITHYVACLSSAVPAPVFSTPIFLDPKDDVVVRVVNISGDSSVVSSTLHLVVLTHD